MKVMWITFAPIGRAAQLLRGAATQSGGWVDATIDGLLPYLKDGRLDLEVVSLDQDEKTVVDDDTGVIYRTVNVARNRGKRGCKDDKDKFKALIDEVSPDVIQIWGTEFTFGLDVIDAAGDIPVCFYIQGVMDSLVKHPLGDLPAVSLFFKLGLSSFFKFRSLRKWHKINSRHVKLEAEMISKSAGLIADNEWTRAQYRECTDKFYFVPLAANKNFVDNYWCVDKCQRHSIFTVAGGICPQKGVHDAVIAVAKLKDKYPDVKLYIPGGISSRKPNFLYDSVFVRHIRKLIEKYDIKDNVCFTGRLSPEQMAEQMAKANAFVMPSSVETHSSSLREAMMLGTPSVSTCVGSVIEFMNHGEDGFVYRYGETETLAYYIDRIFSDDDLAQRLGSSGREKVRRMFPQDKIGEYTLLAYEQMMKEGVKNE